jgi:predicted esterase
MPQPPHSAVAFVFRSSIVSSVALLMILLGGCATTPDADSLLSMPVSFTTIAGAPVVIDGRAGFRALFCDSMRTAGLVANPEAQCTRWLWRLPDEPGGRPPYIASDPAAGQPAVFIFTGAFSECVGDEARPFISGAVHLRASGARVETIVLSGRSGTAANARQIADALERAGVPDAQDLILIGFSKGALDVLRFVVDFPAQARGVDAIVSVASPIFGSPLAEVAAAPYATLGASVPHQKCPPGDGEVLRSLQPAAARAWLEANPLPAHVRYYSVAAFTTGEHVARALQPTWKWLNRIDARNDGQVIAADAVIPGSTLLGYANADHWGVAESLEDVHPFLVGRSDPEPFPRDQLFESIVRYVRSDLR